jgi:hypothetical protein
MKVLLGRDGYGTSRLIRFCRAGEEGGHADVQPDLGSGNSWILTSAIDEI